MAEYHVAKTGSSGGSGSSGSPKLTIAQGLALLSGSDTLTIHDGTYNEPILNTAVPSGASEGARTIVRGATGETVVINGRSPGDYCIGVYNRRFITFKNFIADGVGETTNIGTFVQGDSAVFSDHITFEDLEVRNFKALDTGANTSSGGIGNSSLIYRRLHAHHNGLTHPRPPGLYATHGIYITSTNALVEDCDCHDNNGFGVHVYLASSGITGTILRRNKLHENYSYGYMLGSGSNQVAYNNLVWKNGTHVSGAGGVRILHGVNCRIYHETLYKNTGYGIRVEGDSTSAIVKNCISYLNTLSDLSDSGVGTSKSNNLLGIDPLFVNPDAA